MSNYSRGRSFEYTVKHALEGDGYFCVRAASSKGVADICALKPGQILLVSVKAQGGVIPPIERAALLTVAGNVGALPIHAYRAAPGVIGWRQLTGQAADAWQLWTPDEVGAA